MLELSVQNFDLHMTLTSGQFFRYEQDAHGFTAVTERRVMRLSQQGQKLLVAGADEKFVRQFLGIVPEHDDAITRLSKDEVIAPLLLRYRGLRVMRVDLHESILGFICSSQSNIPKIRMNLHLLASSCGEQIIDNATNDAVTTGAVTDAATSVRHHALPSHGAALSHEMVRAAKTGYRAKFLVATNSLLDDDTLSRIRAAPYTQAHTLLCELPGVGPKVADCICLFGLGHGEAFPVDVHVLRAMRALFPRSRLTDERKVRAFAMKRWGSDAGRAQQVIFQWARDELSHGGR